MAEDIPKTYSSKPVEKKWFDLWQQKKYSHPSEKKSNKPLFSMVIPPPNVTGILHMGHALNNTLQDILVRYYRMKGCDSLWIPGTDHAGIATQNVVERQLKKEGIDRHSLGREDFIDRVWQWRDQYGGTIVKQLERMGCSCDWDRLRFTMDDGLSDAVKEVFIRLFDEGLIYKNNYIINWCPRCTTALSDEEVTHRDLKGKLYHIKYKIQGSGQDSVVIATTRPETLLGDTAIGFHPNDERYVHLKGKQALLPILGRSLAIIQDEGIDPSFGTGVLKITPAHDPNDFDYGIKHNLKTINILNKDGTLNNSAEKYAGLSRSDARETIVKDLEREGYLIKIEDHDHSVGHCYRCDDIVEPYCSDQWFVRMKSLAEPAIKAVESGDIKFHPNRWKKVYLEWMNNIRDWCISRQIWWGHRIPVYYAKNGKFTAARNEDDARKRLGLSENERLTQDPDVLDTWFSSWLWPFSTMGWPQNSTLLDKFYPTKALVTGYEIIFFWVARMIMSGFKFMGKAPFKDVYIHGIVRDQSGAKMSKSKGNVIDPLEIIDEFGADALRYSIISITSEGQDVHASKDRFEIGRNFANKIWNASRYVIQSVRNAESETGVSEIDLNELSLSDLWILSRVNRTVELVTNAIESYRFNEAASKIYDFFWGDYCDWYLEFSKPSNSDPRTQWVLRYVLEKSLKLLHPFMPFITSEIWSILHSKNPHKDLMIEEWPSSDLKWINNELEGDVKEVIALIKNIRNVRGAWNIPYKNPIRALFVLSKRWPEEKIHAYSDHLKRMLNLSSLELVNDNIRPEQSVVLSVGSIEAFVELKGLIDFDSEREKMNAQIQNLNKHVLSIQSRLSNEGFVSKAPRDVVEKERSRKTDLELQLSRLEEHLKSIS